MSDLRRDLYPEIEAGGFSRADTTVEFFTRINSLLRPDMTVVDFGAGRGQFMDEPAWFRRDLQCLRGKVHEVIGLDVDPVVLSNKSLDRAFVLDESERWPLPDNSVDLVVSDWTFEHIDNPAAVSREAARTLRAGGWLCARTPNKWGYIALGSRAIPNRMHGSVLRRLQPNRQARDVFPTRYLLNTPRDVRNAFPYFEVYSYGVNGEPAYFGQSRVAWQMMRVAHQLLPSRLSSTTLFFLRRRSHQDPMG